jgi:hypothetical protein
MKTLAKCKCRNKKDNKLLKSKCNSTDKEAVKYFNLNNWYEKYNMNETYGILHTYIFSVKLFSLAPVIRVYFVNFYISVWTTLESKTKTPIYSNLTLTAFTHMTATFVVLKRCISQMFPRVGLMKRLCLNFKYFRLKLRLCERLCRRELYENPKNLLSSRLRQQIIAHPQRELNSFATVIFCLFSKHNISKNLQLSVEIPS